MLNVFKNGSVYKRYAIIIKTLIKEWAIKVDQRNKVEINKEFNGRSPEFA